MSHLDKDHQQGCQFVMMPVTHKLGPLGDDQICKLVQTCRYHSGCRSCKVENPVKEDQIQKAGLVKVLERTCARWSRYLETLLLKFQ